MKFFFQMLSGTFAAVPGIATLLTAVGVPDPDDKILFGAVVEALGCLSIGLLILNKEKIITASLRKINSWIFTAFAIFISSLVLYIVIYKVCVIQHEDFTRVYFPLFFSGELHKSVLTEGGKILFIEKWFGDGANRKIAIMAKSQLIVTTVIFLFIYQLIFTSLTASFALLAIRENKVE